MCLEVIAQVLELPADQEGIAIVDANGSVRRVSLVMLTLENTQVVPGDWLRVHTGLAMSILPPDEAHHLLELHNEMLAAVSEGES